MSNVSIFKFDGTIQCDPSSKSIPLDEMRKQLINVIGEGAVISAHKDQRMMISLCGVPTGAMNVFEITAAGYDLLENGIAGNLGFAKLDKIPSSNGTEISVFYAQTMAGGIEGWPWSISDKRPAKGVIDGVDTWPWSIKHVPTTIHDLIGRQVRVVGPDDQVTMDLVAGRVTIFVSEDRRIEDIGIEPSILK